jgi:hypothetical protein
MAPNLLPGKYTIYASLNFKPSGGGVTRKLDLKTASFTIED